MAKTVTLRIADDVYERLATVAKIERRSLSNLIELLAMRKLEEDIFTDRIEMDEILSNTPLLQKLTRGAIEAVGRKGKFVK